MFFKNNPYTVGFFIFAKVMNCNIIDISNFFICIRTREYITITFRKF